MTKNWILSFLAHLFFIGLAFSCLERQSVVTLRTHSKTQLSDSLVLDAVDVSAEEVYQQIANIQAQEEAYYLAQEQRKKNYQDSIQALQLSKDKEEDELRKLQSKNQRVKKEIQSLERQLNQDKKSSIRLQEDLLDKKRELARLEKIQEISDEIRQEKIKTDQTYLESYRKKISSYLSKNWNIPVAEDKDLLTCRLDVTLLPTGDVVNVTVTQSSGDFYFDQCAIAAVNKSSPLPILDDLEPRLRPRLLHLTFIPGKVAALEHAD